MLDVTSKTPEAWEISRATPLELGISEVLKGDGLGANSQTELHVYNLVNTNINNYKGRVISKYSKLHGNLYVFFGTRQCWLRVIFRKGFPYFILLV